MALSIKAVVYTLTNFSLRKTQAHTDSLVKSTHFTQVFQEIEKEGAFPSSLHEVSIIRHQSHTKKRQEKKIADEYSSQT